MNSLEADFTSAVSTNKRRRTGDSSDFASLVTLQWTAQWVNLCNATLQRRCTHLQAASENTQLPISVECSKWPAILADSV